MAGRKIPPGSGFTLADVAREAGVSEITVSRVIRSKGPIATETRRRVETAIRKVGYVPNRVAGAMASGASDLVGVIIPSLGNIVFPDVLRGINQSLAQRGYRAVVSVTDYSLEAEGPLVRSLLSWRPAALIVTGCEHTAETRTMLEVAGVTVVEIMDAGPEPIDIAIGMSHEAAARAMADFLLGRGYRRIGYVGHDLDRDLRARKRHAAFVQAIHEAGAERCGEMIVPGPSSVEAGRTALAAMLAGPRRPDAVYFSNDDMAIGGVFHCLAHGIALPDDLAIAGFNGIDLGQSLPQPLTTIRTKRFEIGREAGQAVIDRLDGGDCPTITDVGFDLLPGATA